LLLVLFSHSQIKLESGFGLTYCGKEVYKVNETTFSFNKVTAINQMRLEKDNFSLVSNIAVMMDRTERKITFTPSLAIFDLELRYFYNKFIFSVAHRCVHPISTSSKPLEFEIYGGYDLKFKLLYNIK
jgi:hypothetical protein